MSIMLVITQLSSFPDYAGSKPQGIWRETEAHCSDYAIRPINADMCQLKVRSKQIHLSIKEQNIQSLISCTYQDVSIKTEQDLQAVLMRTAFLK